MGKVPATLWEVRVHRKPVQVMDARAEMIMCLTCLMMMMLRYLTIDSVAFLKSRVWTICMGFMENVCQLLNKPNHISYLRGLTDTRLTLIFVTMDPLFQNATTSIHSNQYCLIEIIDFCLFSTNEKRIWLNILSPNLNSEIPINTRGK